MVGQAGNGQEVMSMLASTTADVLILDLAMPGCSGLDVLSMIKPLTRAKVLVYSGWPAEIFAARCTHLGGSDFLGKDCNVEQIVRSVRRLAGNSIDARLPNTSEGSNSNCTRDVTHDQLTPREFAVLTKLAQGLSVGVTAKLLCLSTKSISLHRARLLSKLRLNTNAELTRYAFKHRLISEVDPSSRARQMQYLNLPLQRHTPAPSNLLGV